MGNQEYTNLLALFGIGGAHPGGLELTKEILLNKEWQGVKLLEIGCGTGQTSALLHSIGVQLTSIDSHPLMIEKANKRFNNLHINFQARLDNIEKSSFQSAFFEYVLAESVLTFTNLNLSIAEIYRVLTDEGTLIALEMTKKPVLPTDVEKQLRNFYGIPAILTKEGWYQLCRKHGFQHIDISVLSLDDIVSEETEIDPSLNIEDKYFEVMHEHEKLTMISRPFIDLSLIIAKK